MAEALTGDLTPLDALELTEEQRQRAALEADDGYQPPPEWRLRKVKAEQAAVAALTERIPPNLARRITAAWQEYEDRSTAEARLVAQLDKLEAYLQGTEYVASGRLEHEHTIRPFRTQSERVVELPLVQSLLRVLQLQFPEEGS
jgi:5'-deoxynucleotidase YfbR-like HD superfamily hydrolase